MKLFDFVEPHVRIGPPLSERLCVHMRCADGMLYPLLCCRAVTMTSLSLPSHWATVLSTGRRRQNLPPVVAVTRCVRAALAPNKEPHHRRLTPLQQQRRQCPHKKHPPKLHLWQLATTRTWKEQQQQHPLIRLSSTRQSLPSAPRNLPSRKYELPQMETRLCCLRHRVRASLQPAQTLRWTLKWSSWTRRLPKQLQAWIPACTMKLTQLWYDDYMFAYSNYHWCFYIIDEYECVFMGQFPLHYLSAFRIEHTVFTVHLCRCVHISFEQFHSPSTPSPAPSLLLLYIIPVPTTVPQNEQNPLVIFDHACLNVSILCLPSYSIPSGTVHLQVSCLY